VIKRLVGCANLFQASQITFGRGMTGMELRGDNKMSMVCRISLLGLGVWMNLSLSPCLAQGVYNANGVWAGADAGAYSGGTVSLAGADRVMSDVKSQGAMSAGRDVRCSACEIEGNVAAGHDVYLQHNPHVGSIAAGHDVTLLDSHVWGSISAGHGAVLLQSSVQGNISTGNEADLQASQVQGSLSQGGHHLTLDGSSVAGDIYFRGAPLPGGTSAQESSVISQNGSSSVRVGGHSLSRVNGYTVQGAEQQTTLITPQQTIYVNGRKVSGDGPKTYAEYRDAFPMAPVVAGPGWTDGAPASPAYSASSRSVVSVLELSNNSAVNGQVVFESGYGKVILHPGSRFAGPVVNGRVEKAAR
jgi:uncharacterized Zn-binding protein involved in type VI secretion